VGDVFVIGYVIIPCWGQYNFDRPLSNHKPIGGLDVLGRLSTANCCFAWSSC